MTAEKAIEILSDVGDINRCCAEDAEALDMAIEALEQQICDNDCEHCDWVTCPKMEEETERKKGVLEQLSEKQNNLLTTVKALDEYIDKHGAIY